VVSCAVVVKIRVFVLGREKAFYNYFGNSTLGARTSLQGKVSSKANCGNNMIGNRASMNLCLGY
jgi:hypothetical protein